MSRTTSDDRHDSLGSYATAPSDASLTDLLDRLLRLEAETVATITVPLDRSRPGNRADRIRLRNLAAQARDRISETVDRQHAQRVLTHLAGAVAQAGTMRGGNGLLLVATEEHAEAHLVPFSVPESLSIGTKPATRFLIQGIRRSPRYRVLVLSDRPTRLFEAVRDDLVEAVAGGFPMNASVVPRDLRAVAGRFALAPGRDDSDEWRMFYRAVDEAVTDVSRDDPLPLVLVGVDRSLVLFEEVSAHGRSAVGRVAGAHAHATAHELAQSVWPVVRAYLRQRQRDAIVALRRAGGGRAVTGIDDVWQLAQQGRGHLLVVEEDYVTPSAQEIDGRLVFGQPADVPDVEDPVNEIVEHVARTGGIVEFVPAEALREFEHIGLILR